MPIYNFCRYICEKQYTLVLEKHPVKTSDGSSTIFVPELNETYHSTHGALQESLHVFISEGLQYRSDLSQLSILEVGFGTGLNALLTFKKAAAQKKQIQYTSLEAYPLDWEVVRLLNYSHLMQMESLSSIFEKMHTCAWELYTEISPFFSLRKFEAKLQEVRFENEFDLIYFDAFSPGTQPELWTEEIFASMYNSLKPGGVLVTYCAKGTVKRALKSVGFNLQSIPGPPGKREMSRAVK